MYNHSPPLPACMPACLPPLGKQPIAHPIAGQAGFIRYTVLVTVGDQSWSVVRRFNDFQPLHEAVARAFPAKAFHAQLPPKRWFGRSVLINNKAVWMGLCKGGLSTGSGRRDQRFPPPTHLFHSKTGSTPSSCGSARRSSRTTWTP